MTHIDKFLESTRLNPTYWAYVKKVAHKLGSDGCTGGTQFFRAACLEHDIHYRTKRFLTGVSIDKDTADYIFRRRMQQKSIFRKFSPMSWWRWVGVRTIIGRLAWEGKL